MDILVGAGLLALSILLLLGLYLWHKGKPFREKKKANRERPNARDGMPTSSRRRMGP